MDVQISTLLNATQRLEGFVYEHTRLCLWRSPKWSRPCSVKWSHWTRRGWDAFSFQVEDPRRWRSGVRLRRRRENVVPVMARRAEALDGGVDRDHGLRHLVAGGVGVKAAVEGLILCE